MVWYRSTRVGCAVAYCPQGEYTYYYVCHYCPAGNVQGKIPTPYKLGSPCADCPNACENNLCICTHFTILGICHSRGNVQGKIPTPYKLGSHCADCPNACDNNLCTNPCPHNNKFGNCPDLKRNSGCNLPQMKEWCPASCQCTNEII
ncbi:cysteine-rich venom protein-like [Sphaerodactylus townsendi]|uniref:cysteine-rich venom protein-like n=1 Tax=Sphaerodactylus townsendi TaxID=933632 RepID=UPI002026C364|nr:cysteine-rich venom protein-like [Sphaerodactylus townsendi]